MWTQQLGATLALFDAGAAALTASGDPSNKAALAKAMSTLKTVTIDRPDRLHLRTRAERLAGPDHRHAMGQGAGGVEVPARVSRDGERDRPECSDPGETQAVQQLTAARARTPDAPSDGLLLEAEGLTKSFGALVVLDGVDFSLAPARRSASSGRTARERQRCSACWSARMRRPAGGCAFSARTSPSADGGAMPAGARAHAPDSKPFSGMTVFENVFTAAAHGARPRA